MSDETGAYLDPFPVDDFTLDQLALTARLAAVEALADPDEMFRAMYCAATDPDGILALSVIAASNAVRAALHPDPSEASTDV